MGRSSLAPGRSTSLPNRPHPLREIIESELSEMKAWVASPLPTASAMIVGIRGLANLLESMEEVLRSPLAQQAVARLRREKCRDELLDGYVKLLDACNTLTGAILVIKEHTLQLRSTIRRRGAHAAVAGDVEAYIRTRKEVKNAVDGCLKDLKIMEGRDRCFFNIQEKDADVSTVVDVLKDVRTVSVSVFRCLLSFLSMQKTTAKHTRWSSAVSGWFALSRSPVSDEAGEGVSELESVDASMVAIRKSLPNRDIKADMVQLAQRRLGTLESCITEFEDGAECIFRRLIQNRVTLLNIISL